MKYNYESSLSEKEVARCRDALSANMNELVDRQNLLIENPNYDILVTKDTLLITFAVMNTSCLPDIGTLTDLVRRALKKQGLSDISVSNGRQREESE